MGQPKAADRRESLKHYKIVYAPSESDDMAVPSLDHHFNDDLLISREDQEYAKSTYAEIYHVLDHPELRREFIQYDNIANSSKKWVQRAGLGAVALAAMALLGSAITPVVKQIPNVPTWVSQILLCLEIGGIVGVLIAAGGLWIAGKKKAWLETRMMVEIIRLWHFQSLICCGKAIEASCNSANPNEPAAFVAERDRKFKAFMHEWRGTLDSHLTELIENPGEGYELLHDEETEYTAGSPVIEKIFAAYKAMRFRHQANYAAHKLQRTTPSIFAFFKWPAVVLQERMQGCATTFLLMSLGCSLVIVLGHFFHWEFSHHPGWPVGIIFLLILNVATRAVQDGLAGPEEVQRYNDYAGKIQYLRQRFDTVQNPKEKLELMIELERAALEELKGFLRAHHEARFVV